MMAKVENKRTINLNIDQSLWHKARVAAAQKDTTLTKIVDAALRDYLKHTDL